MAVGIADTWSPGKLPQSRVGVSSMLGTVSSALSSISRSEDNTYIKQMISDLSTIRAAVLSLEQKFYQQLKATDIKEIQRRLDLLNNDPGFRAMVNLSDSEFSNLVDAASQTEGIDFTQPAYIFFKRERTRKQLVEASGVGQISAETLIDALNSQNKITKMTASRINKGDSKGLSKFIANITYIPENNRFKVDFGGQAVPSDWKKRLEEEYGVYFRQAGAFDRRKFLRSWLEKNIANGVIRSAVLYQFDNCAGRYDLNSSEASIKGFLGEVHAAASLNILTNSHDAIATGNLRKVVEKGGIGGGQEIPIDMVFREFGFQIKNYKIIGGKANLGNFMSEEGIGTETFIRQRAGIQNEMANLLVSLFGSLQFNQVDPDSNGSFNSTRTSIENLAYGEQIKTVFDAHINNILKISEKFQSSADSPFGTKQVYYNTFFLIGAKLVPSSAILTAIIEQLRKASDSYIISQYSISGPEGEPRYNDTDPQGNKSVSTSSAANKIKMSYKISLKLDSILSLAMGQVS